MSPLQCSVHGGAYPYGGVLSYPFERLHEEIAFIAFHFHWSQDEILNLEHSTRQRWVAEINKINQQLGSS